MQVKTPDEGYVRLIFGLKLKQIRSDRGLSLFGLSKKTGLSKSYLNEIEKGKKYPKTDKIILLAKALSVPYEDLVSLKLTGRIAPLAEIFQSGVLKEIPLSLFGISEQGVIDMIAEAPAKTSAFINTLFDLSRAYDLRREGFFLAALRSYQEMHLNWFPDIETQATLALSHYGLSDSQIITSEDLQEILIDDYHYRIDQSAQEQLDYPELRSIYSPEPNPQLWLSPSLSASQKRFILAKELAYARMNVRLRPHTFTWIRFDSFDEVLHNFEASYFAGALLMPPGLLEKDLKDWFAQSTFSADFYYQMQSRYGDSPETFLHRLTNLLPGLFGIRELFFLRFQTKRLSSDHVITKELHLSKTHNPHRSAAQEHYCGRWLALDIAEHPNQYHNLGQSSFGVQISHYHDGASYFVLASYNPEAEAQGGGRSVCIGIELTTANLRKIRFLKDPSIPEKQVGVTCESCPIQDCQQRRSEAFRLRKAKRDQRILNLVKDYQNQSAQNKLSKP